MTDPIVSAAGIVGAPYGMSASDVVAHLLTGDRTHPDAPARDCGAADLRDSTYWCGRPPGHTGDHMRRWNRRDWNDEIEAEHDSEPKTGKDPS